MIINSGIFMSAVSMGNNFIGALPPELYLHIFGFLGPFDLIIASEVDKQWKELANDEILWRQHEPKNLSPLIAYQVTQRLNVSKSNPGKENFKNHYTILKKIEANRPVLKKIADRLPDIILEDLFEGSENFITIATPFFLGVNQPTISEIHRYPELIPSNIPVVAGTDKKNCAFIQLNLIALSNEGGTVSGNNCQVRLVQVIKDGMFNGMFDCEWKFNDKSGQLCSIDQFIPFHFPHADEAFDSSILGLIHSSLKGKKVNLSDYIESYPNEETEYQLYPVVES